MATLSWGESNRVEQAKQTLRAMLPQTILNWREANYFGKYGEVEMHLLEFLCRRDQDAIDVGANYGGYVHFMRRHARRVVAFEPIPAFVELLRRKFSRDVMINSIALSDGAGDTELYIPMIDGVMISGCSTISADASITYPAHSVLKVRRERLDNVYDGTAGFIKIDVEGHEQAVLDGAVETIGRCQPRMLVEVDDRLSPGGLERARKYFTQLDYRGFFVHEGHIKPIERFSIDRMQHPANLPNLTAPLQVRQRFGRYIYNFIFLPAQEPELTLWKM